MPKKGKPIWRNGCPYLDKIGPPYLEIHPEGWALIAIVAWVFVALPLIVWATQ